MADGDEAGWSEVTARAVWTCPECKVTSPAVLWRETEAGCEDCGSHDARECPNPACEEVFDHVWGSQKIEDESAEALAAATGGHFPQVVYFEPFHVEVPAEVCVKCSDAEAGKWVPVSFCPVLTPTEKNLALEAAVRERRAADDLADLTEELGLYEPPEEAGEEPGHGYWEKGDC